MIATSYVVSGCRHWIILLRQSLNLMIGTKSFDYASDIEKSR